MRAVVVALKEPEEIAEPGKDYRNKHCGEEERIDNPSPPRHADKCLRKENEANQATIGEGRFQVVRPAAEAVAGSEHVIRKQPQDGSNIMQRGFETENWERF